MLATVTVTLATDPTTTHTGTSLRDAIALVDSGADTTIAFNIPVTAAGNKTIVVTSPLPAITKPVTIDGTTEPGYAGTPVVSLTRANTTVTGYGLLLSGGNSTVKGLSIYGFGGYGLRFDNGGNNTVVNDYIGVNTTGTIAPGNGAGIWLNNSSGNTIGGSTAAAGNIISGNLNDGIDVGATSLGNTITGNSIGTNKTGALNLSNLGNGITIDAAGVTTATTIIGNTVAESGYYGIGLSSATNVVIQGNTVATSEHRGIAVIDSSKVTIGGTTTAAANTLTSNGVRDNDFDSYAAGVAVVNGSTNVTVTGNTFNNNGRGIRISGAGAAGTTPSIVVTNNTITDSTTHGIYIDNAFGGPSQNVLLTANTITGSGGPGLRVDYSSNITIGQVGAAINDIEHNAANGIALYYDSNVVIANNKISSNAANGVYIPAGDTAVTMPSGNTIQDNGKYGVEVLSTVVSLPSTRNNTITNNTLGNVVNY